MARIVIGIVAAAIVALAIWAAFPSTSPLAPTGQPHRIAPVVPSAGERQRGMPTSAAPAADGDLEARINACLSAQREVASARAQRGGPAPAGQPSDAAVVSRGCAPLYHEAGCRDALMRFDDPPPEKRSASVLTACAHAYCGLLGESKPAVCAHADAVPDNEQQFAEWNDLRTAILTHDIGAAAAQRVLAPPAR